MSEAPHGPLYGPEDFPPSGTRPFPLAEVYGFVRELPTYEARQNYAAKHCPFTESACEKYVQYGYGYCSVVYKAANDARPEIYAVCDHRLDGAPVERAILDYFGTTKGVERVSELTFSQPSQSFDYVAYRPSDGSFVAIETQAIDIRGGGVGPAWQSYVDGHPRDWRAYFTVEAEAKARRDSVDFGVNMANIVKRFGLQVAVKSGLLRSVGSALYAVIQDRCFSYLATRVRADWHDDPSRPWDICFLTFEYTGVVFPNGQLEMSPARTFRTTYESYARALSETTSAVTREQFIRAIEAKLARPNKRGDGRPSQPSQ